MNRIKLATNHLDLIQSACSHSLDCCKKIVVEAAKNVKAKPKACNICGRKLIKKSDGGTAKTWVGAVKKTLSTNKTKNCIIV